MNSKFITYFMNVAEETAKLSNANRLKVGAIAVKDNRIISIGYNGTPPGWDNSCENSDNVTHPYVLHAEENLIAKLCKSNESSQDCEIFLTHSPCMQCAKILANSGIKKVYFKKTYRSLDGVIHLKKCNVEVILLDYVDYFLSSYDRFKTLLHKHQFIDDIFSITIQIVNNDFTQIYVSHDEISDLYPLTLEQQEYLRLKFT